MEMDSREQHQASEEILTVDEARAILEQIHLQEHLNAFQPEPKVRDDEVTIAAVCEMTGRPDYEVRKILEQIREEDLAAELARRLREAEEPLYRVERPGFEDPDGGMKVRRFYNNMPKSDSILDRSTKDRQAHEHHAKQTGQAPMDWVSKVIMACLAMAFAFILIEMLAHI